MRDLTQPTPAVPERDGEETGIAEHWAKLVACVRRLPSVDDGNEILGAVHVLRHLEFVRGRRFELEMAARPEGEDARRLDEIERGEWRVTPIIGGGWIIEDSVPTGGGDYSERRLAWAYRKSLRETIDMVVLLLDAITTRDSEGEEYEHENDEESPDDNIIALSDASTPTRSERDG